MKWKRKKKSTEDLLIEAHGDLEETLNGLKGSFMRASHDDRLGIVLDYQHNLDLYKAVAPEAWYEEKARWLYDVNEVFELKLKLERRQ